MGCTCIHRDFLNFFLFSCFCARQENESWAMGETEEEDSVEDNVCEVRSE